MRCEDISEAMNMIDDELLLHAAGVRNGGKRRMTKKNMTIIAAAAAVLAVGGVTVAAGASGGWMKDIKNGYGAITGQVYKDADEEIGLNVISADEKGISVIAEIKTPDKPPYTALDTLRLGDYRIIGADECIIASGDRTEPAVLSDGQAVIYIPADLSGSGELRLVADGFIGEAKADQPLEIEGTWECSFTAE